MSRMLPYPGRNESFSSWDFRCKQWENRRAEWNRELNARHTNWGGYNYRRVVVGGEYTLPTGQNIKVEKTWPSRSKKQQAVNWCRANFCTLLKVQLGNPNLITSREDFIAVKPENVPVGIEVVSIGGDDIYSSATWLKRNRDEVYSNDSH